MSSTGASIGSGLHTLPWQSFFLLISYSPNLTFVLCWGNFKKKIFLNADFEYDIYFLGV